MTTVIPVPQSLDDVTFEQVLERLAPLAPDEKLLIDARHARWASPYGLVGAADARADPRGPSRP